MVHSVIDSRLYNQHLLGEVFETPEEVVSWLGAVQAQDFPAAKWALGLRMKNTTDQLIEAAYNKGSIIRTHVMRPTWHFVLPENLKWMQKLTSPYVKKLMGHYNRKLELDEALFKKSNALIVKALENHTYLTRQELKKIIHENGITTDVQRLAHIIIWAELDALICSGPKVGKQLTYALVEKRITESKELDGEKALAILALTYFKSHGPAQVKDFSWWSGLPMAKATEAVELLGSQLEKEESNGKVYWCAPPLAQVAAPKSHALLLSIYDEYTIAYKDRTDLSAQRDIERMISMGNALTAVLVFDGLVAGTWKRKISKHCVEIVLTPFKKLTKAELISVEREVKKYGLFLGLKSELKLA